MKGPLLYIICEEKQQTTRRGDLYFKERPQLESHTLTAILIVIEIMGRYSTFCSTLAKQTDSAALGVWNARAISLCGAVSRCRNDKLFALLLTRTQQQQLNTPRMRFRACILGDDGRGNLLACVKCIERLSSANYTIYKHAR